MALKGLGVNALRQRATEEAKVGNELIQQQLADACTGTPPLPAPVGLDPPTPKTRNPPTPTAGVGWGWGASPPPSNKSTLDARQACYVACVALALRAAASTHIALVRTVVGGHMPQVAVQNW